MRRLDNRKPGTGTSEDVPRTAAMTQVQALLLVTDFDGFPSPAADEQRRIESIPPKKRPTGAKLPQTIASEVAYSPRGSLPNIALAKTKPSPKKKPRI